MDGSGAIPIQNRRRSSSQANRRASGQYGPVYRRDSNISTSSFLDDVEMAQEEVFGGPVAESVQTSVSSFAHRRARADSTASFTYYQEDEDEELEPSGDDSAILDDEEGTQYEEDNSADLEAGELADLRRSSSARSRDSVHDRLLRSDSGRTAGSNFERGYRTSQKIYIVAEDLTVAVAGFRTSTLGYALYITICVLTLGIGYLVLRWLPRWQVQLVGKPSPLRNCTWTVIENQWGEFGIQDVESQEYGRSLSTVFGSPEKRYIVSYDEEDDDPILETLRILDYRYMRFFYHPLKDKFILCNSWKDPMWTDVKSMRGGIDGDEKEKRELVFGKNLIDIEQKTITQLLVDEVQVRYHISCFLADYIGVSSFLHIPNRQFNTLVP
jgi:cation-transporting ATPase 13A2